MLFQKGNKFTHTAVDVCGFDTLVLVPDNSFHFSSCFQVVIIYFYINFLLNFVSEGIFLSMELR